MVSQRTKQGAMKTTEKPAVASLVWDLSSELHQSQADAVARLGYQHQFFLYDEPLPPDADIVLVQGPYGPLLPLARQLIDRPAEERPVLAYWFQQSLGMVRPEWIRRLLPRTFFDPHRNHRKPGWVDWMLDRLMPRLLDARDCRFRFLGDILWLYRHRVLDVLALSSTVYARYLKQLGIPSILTPRGYHPSYGQILDLERDIAVVWMGKTRNRRRKQVVHWMEEQLEGRGLLMQIYDGEHNDFIFDDRRTEILNRTRFVLNVLPDPTWEVSMRYYIAAANGAVVLTEPGENAYPFVPGKHLVECPVEQMPEKVIYYLQHEDEWNAISEAMLSLMQEELTLKRSIARILDRAEAVLDRRRGRRPSEGGRAAQASLTAGESLGRRT